MIIHYAEPDKPTTSCGQRLPGKGWDRKRMRNAPSVIRDRKRFLAVSHNLSCRECRNKTSRRWET